MIEPSTFFMYANGICCTANLIFIGYLLCKNRIWPLIFMNICFAILSGFMTYFSISIPPLIKFTPIPMF